MSSIVNALSYVACIGCVGLGLALTNAVAAQDVEKIPDPSTPAGFFYLDSITENEPHQRIVEGRPRLYLFKRAVNPLSWMGKLFETTLLSAEKSRLHALAQKRETSPKQAVSSL